MAEEMRSADQLAHTILGTPGVLEQIQRNPEETITRLAEQAKQEVPRVLEQDRLIYRIVVSSLSLVVLLVVIGVIGLAFVSLNDSTNSIKIPDVLTALGSAAIGALAGILAPSLAPRG